jgi:hypothetical protein
MRLHNNFFHEKLMIIEQLAFDRDQKKPADWNGLGNRRLAPRRSVQKLQNDCSGLGNAMLWSATVFETVANRH